jgi:hypothetical protein
MPCLIGLLKRSTIRLNRPVPIRLLNLSLRFRAASFDRLKKLPTIQKALHRSTPTMAMIDHQCLHLYVIVSAENAHGGVSSKRASGMQKFAVQT